MLEMKQILTKPQDQPGGFALPLAMGIGLVLIALATATLLLAEDDNRLSAQRRDSSDSLLVAETGVAITLAQLNKPNNSGFLTRNLDQVNTATSKNFLGPDGLPNTNDETGTLVDQWVNYNYTTQPCYPTLSWGAPNITLTGTVGTNGTYAVRAYRYNPQQRKGTLLVEGEQDGQKSYVSVQMDIEPSLDYFPGVMAIDPSGPSGFSKGGAIALRGRTISGSKGNVYYPPYNSANPSFTDKADPGDAARQNALNAIWSSATQDGAGSDSVAETLVGCRLTPQIPTGVMGTNMGTINTSKTLEGVGGSVWTLYRIEAINLSNNDILTIDTTGGPVKIDVIETGAPAITLRNNAKILNIRTDGLPPRVGDVRIIARGNSRIDLYDQTCIQDVFLFSGKDELRLLTSDPGCPSGRNTNFEGVVWAEAILSSKNNASNRNVQYLGFLGERYDTIVTPGATSGIHVPEDLSSLADLFSTVQWPTYYRIKEVKNWQRVRV